MKRTLFIMVGIVVLNACSIEFGIPASSERNWTAFNRLDMEDSPALESQELGFMPPPHGAVAMGQNFYPYARTPEDRLRAGDDLKYPNEVTPEILEIGKDKYDTYCSVCHGPDGKGPLTAKPSGLTKRAPQLMGANLTDERLYGLATKRPGEIYHVITMGNVIMGAYKSQLEPDERWAVVRYVEALGRVQNPNSEDG